MTEAELLLLAVGCASADKVGRVLVSSQSLYLNHNSHDPSNLTYATILKLRVRSFILQQ